MSNRWKKPTGFALWGFQIARKNATTAQTGWFKGQFFGSAEEAEKERLQLLGNAAIENPGWDIDVTAVLLEHVGPKTAERINAIALHAESRMVLARFLAAQLAVHVARASLEVNPNLDRIAERILDEAQNALSGAATQQDGPKILGADGRPAVSGGRA